MTAQAAADHSGSGTEIHRLCVFDLSLTCGHIATISVAGWYPVSVACCDRLGGTWFNGQYIAFASGVDFAALMSERYEQRPVGTSFDRARLLARRLRTDEPRTSQHPWGTSTSGRFPERVGAARPNWV